MNPKVTPKNMKIFRLDRKRSQIQRKKIKKVAYKNKYLEEDADKVLQISENYVAPIVKGILENKSIFGQLFVEKQGLMYLELKNYMNLCIFISQQMNRSLFLRNLLKKGFSFDIINKTTNEVHSTGFFNFDQRDIQKMHSNIVKNMRSIEINHFTKLELKNRKTQEIFKINDSHLTELKREFKTEKKNINVDEQFSNFFMNHKPILIINSTNLSFITGDSPVVNLGKNLSSGEIILDSPTILTINPKITIALIKNIDWKTLLFRGKGVEAIIFKNKASVNYLNETISNSSLSYLFADNEELLKDFLA